MTLQRDPALPLNEPEEPEETREASAPSGGIVERCEFEELLERAMEILKARRVSAGSAS